MSYTIIIKRQAKKKLQSLPQAARSRIAEKIHWLGDDPDDSRLDVKRMVGEPYYRLRVGDWRVIFGREDEVKIVAIEKIKPRGDAYK